MIVKGWGGGKDGGWLVGDEKCSGKERCGLLLCSGSIALTSIPSAFSAGVAADVPYPSPGSC